MKKLGITIITKTIIPILIKAAFLAMACMLIQTETAFAFGLKDVYKNLHINNTEPGKYHDAAAGWYSGGSSVMRTRNTSIQPFAMSAPSLNTGCSGIDAFAGSFSMMSGNELVSIAENIGSQAVVYGFHLGLKTYAPQIEQILANLRNLQMELNQFGIGHCKTTQAMFAAALPQNTAMYETVCEEMAAGGGSDLGGQRKKCRDYIARKAAVARAQERDPDLLMDNYNLFIKAATAAGIPKEMHAPLMSVTGTIVVRDGVMIPYPSLASDRNALSPYIKGGSDASIYGCDNAACMNVSVNNNITISPEDSYAGKARSRLDRLKTSMIAQINEFSDDDKHFLDSLGTSFPVFDHITLEAVSGVSILDGSSEVIARYMLLQHLTAVVNDIRKSIIALKQKQINDRYLVEYEKSLTKLLNFASNEWGEVMSDSDRINERAEKIEKHVMARERG